MLSLIYIQRQYLWLSYSPIKILQPEMSNVHFNGMDLPVVFFLQLLEFNKSGRRS